MVSIILIINPLINEKMDEKYDNENTDIKGKNITVTMLLTDFFISFPFLFIFKYFDNRERYMTIGIKSKTSV